MSEPRPVWLVVGIIAYDGETPVAVFSSEAAAIEEAARLNREGDLVIFDDGYAVRGPFTLDERAGRA